MILKKNDEFIFTLSLKQCSFNGLQKQYFKFCTFSGRFKASEKLGLETLTNNRRCHDNNDAAALKGGIFVHPP